VLYLQFEIFRNRKTHQLS